ncbi:MAG: segregation/condensation protein A [Alphaproteobacteria bacterium]|nr:MAG: segregation/condensation protein A [Alphaproteobacteria bacterium]
MPEDFADGLSTATLETRALLVDVDGFEGPLDLLLTLARSQKVDLRRVSILGLAEQYLEFVAAARELRIELAADYLVMAAWLAWLKSRLLLPPDPEAEGPSGEELAAHLAFQLERLEAMRRAAARLMGRDRLGREVFARGMTETVTLRRKVSYEATLLDLLRAYARVKTREDYTPLQVTQRPVLSMEQALERLRGLIGQTLDWTVLQAFLPEGWRVEPERRRSAIAATFAAMLELVKGGEAEIRQEAVFAPLMLRAVRRGAEG